MSIVPEAHEWLRHRAYKHWGGMPRAERSVVEIAAWCEAQLRSWRDGRPDGCDLADVQLRTTAKGVAEFMINKYGQRRKRLPAKTSFESRALHRHVLRVSADMMAEDRGVETLSARRVSDLLGNSRSTTARVLSAVRGKPRRDAVAAKLSPNEAKLHAIVESILPGDGERVVRVADLVERMWPKAGAKVKSATARVQRKRLLDALSALARLSIDAKAEGDLVALIRGRRWTDEAAAARLKAGVSAPDRKITAVPAPDVGGSFWQSREVRCLVAALRAAGGGDLLGYAFHDLICLQTAIRDTRPVTWAYRKAVENTEGGGGRFGEFVWRINKPGPTQWRLEPAARDALFAAAGVMEELCHSGTWQHPAIVSIERICGEFVGLRSPSAEGKARIAAFKEIIQTARDPYGDSADCYSALLLCERLAEEEAVGRWSAEPYLNPDCPF